MDLILEDEEELGSFLNNISKILITKTGSSVIKKCEGGENK